MSPLESLLSDHKDCNQTGRREREIVKIDNNLIWVLWIGIK